MAEHHILSTQDSDAWLAFLAKTSVPDIYFTPGYAQIFNREGDARLFVYEKDAQFIVYPYILRRVHSPPGKHTGETYYDITSPYGYGGPLYSDGVDESLISDFYTCFKQYCRENQIITEFIRFHPVLQNHVFMNGQVDVQRNSTVVFIDLAKNIDEIWSGYQRSNRKNINKAMREGVSVTVETSPRHFNEFIAIYEQTMERNQADQFYYFSPGFFSRIHQGLKNHYVYAQAWLNGKIVSTELLIYNQHYIHSFLGGTLAEYFPYRPNNLLKHEVIKWAKQQGIRYFILGGGRSDNDGIFKYKNTFSGELAGYYIGKKIHNREVVAELTGAFSQPDLTSGFFPPYRR